MNVSAISAQLSRILSSRTLSRASYLNRLLQCCVEQTLAGNSSQLKEIWLGANVFKRKAGFNPAKDPIVRVQARRLRQKLELYYQTEGIQDSVRILLPLGSYVPYFSFSAPRLITMLPAGREVALAVLPLTPLDGDPESIRFAESITAELTHELAAIGGINVVSRTSALAFKGVAQDIREIGKSLSAEVIVEGWTSLTEHNHRITLQLTEVETGYHRWAGWFEKRNSASPAGASDIALILRRELLAAGARPAAIGEPAAVVPITRSAASRMAS